MDQYAAGVEVGQYPVCPPQSRDTSTWNHSRSGFQPCRHPQTQRHRHLQKHAGNEERQSRIGSGLGPRWCGVVNSRMVANGRKSTKFPSQTGFQQSEPNCSTSTTQKMCCPSMCQANLGIFCRFSKPNSQATENGLLRRIASSGALTGDARPSRIWSTFELAALLLISVTGASKRPFQV